MSLFEREHLLNNQDPVISFTTPTCCFSNKPEKLYMKLYRPLWNHLQRSYNLQCKCFTDLIVGNE